MGMTEKPTLPETLFDKRYGAQVASASPRGHPQRVPGDLLKCPNCRDNRCGECPDKVLMLLQRNRVCTCEREGHLDAITGEPRRAQIVDPISGDIYGPGGSVVSQAD